MTLTKLVGISKTAWNKLSKHLNKNGITIGVISNIVMTVANILLVLTAFLALQKTEPIYGIERMDYNDAEVEKLKDLNKKLSAGNYILLYARDLGINEPGSGDKHVIVLGKIKK